MSTEELAVATKEFDDPNYDPPARKPTKTELAILKRVQKKAAQDQFRVAIALDERLIEQADEYAVDHGMTFSEVVTDALKRLMQKKSA